MDALSIALPLKHFTAEEEAPQGLLTSRSGAGEVAQRKR